MNEEGSISVQQPSMTAQDNTTHKRPRHDSRKDPVEPNKLTRLEQSDIALKVGFGIVYARPYLI